MRKATLLATALIATLALSVGAFAYPVVVGTHPAAAAHAATPAVSHPTGDDNSTGNGTSDQLPSAGNEHENETAENETSELPVAPFGNETNETEVNDTVPIPPAPDSNDTVNGSEMGNVSVEHNVTATVVGNTTYVNGTIVVVQNGTTLVEVTFQIVVHDNGTANVTFSGTETVGSSVVSVHGYAVYSPDRHSVDVFGVASSTQNGAVQWVRVFGFELLVPAPVPH